MVFSSMNLMAQVVNMTANTQSVMGGEYIVMSNVWGASTPQTMQVDLGGTYFKVTSTGHNNTGGTPASYPFIFKGDHYGTRTTKNNPLPMGIENISSAPFTWKISTNNAAGNWNCAYESWFTDPSAANPNTYRTELMIWINYSGNASPAGAQVGTVSFSGHTWTVTAQVMTSGTSSWNYVAYKINGVTDSVSLDLKDFIRDALSRGYLYTPWILRNMEAGFEIWSDGAGLTTNYYSAAVLGGGVPENYAPVPFLLATPINNKSVTSAVIPFAWRPAVDPNLDPIEYILHLSGPNLDTTIGQIYDTSYTFDGTKSLKSFTNYSWYVEATDGIDTTQSTQQRTVRTLSVTGIETGEQVPLQLSLDQNYPNPFNPITVIHYSLDQRGWVSLKVMNLLGQVVATLAEGIQESGTYQTTFNAANLPSGVYFSRLQSGHEAITRKMTVMK